MRSPEDFPIGTIVHDSWQPTRRGMVIKHGPHVVYVKWVQAPWGLRVGGTDVFNRQHLQFLVKESDTVDAKKLLRALTEDNHGKQYKVRETNSNTATGMRQSYRVVGPDGKTVRGGFHSREDAHQHIRTLNGGRK
jgi:hypothetical protein